MAIFQVYSVSQRSYEGLKENISAFSIISTNSSLAIQMQQNYNRPSTGGGGVGFSRYGGGTTTGRYCMP